MIFQPCVRNMHHVKMFSWVVVAYFTLQWHAQATLNSLKLLKPLDLQLPLIIKHSMIPFNNISCEGSDRGASFKMGQGHWTIESINQFCWMRQQSWLPPVQWNFLVIPLSAELWPIGKSLLKITRPGKRWQKLWKDPPLFMGNLTISMDIFNGKLIVFPKKGRSLVL